MFKYTALIVEPRKHKALAFVLENFLTNLSDDWGILIFHGIQNKEFVQDIIDNKLYKYKTRIIKLIQLNVDNLNYTEYATLCKMASFYKCIPTEIFLKFETDSLILSKNRHLINDFLQYDYVGAPWINGIVGNGGLSLRKKSKMIEICNKIDPHLILAEDVYFCCQTEVPLNIPDFNKAKNFSVETVFNETSFGIHAPWKHLNIFQLGILVSKYPDIETLFNLNS